MRLSSSSTSSALSIEIEVAAPWGDAAEYLQIELVLHDEVSVAFFATVGCARQGSEQRWLGEVNVGEGLSRLVEVTGVKVSPRVDLDAVPPIWPAEHGPPGPVPVAAFFLEPPIAGPWLVGEEAENERVRLSQARAEFFGKVLESPSSSSLSPIFAAVMVTNNVRLTVPHRVPGMVLAPLEESALGSDVASVLNGVLPLLGYQCGVDPSSWLMLIRRVAPAAIVHAPSIRAASAEDAAYFIADLALQLLDVTTLRRGDRPRLLGGVVLRRSAVGQVLEVLPWSGTPSYSGNLLGGDISGEGPKSLLALWDGVQQRPRARLWLSMYCDAIADDRSDYRFFRCFNLLEGIANEIIPRGTDAIDESGAPLLMSDGTPYTTKVARGNVFMLLRRITEIRPVGLAYFATTSEAPAPGEPNARIGVPGDLWRELAVWVKIRNTVAHEGTWRLAPGVVADAKRRTLESEVAAYSRSGGGVDMGFEELERTISRACEFVVHLAITGQI